MEDNDLRKELERVLELSRSEAVVAILIDENGIARMTGVAYEGSVDVMDDVYKVVQDALCAKFDKIDVTIN